MQNAQRDAIPDEQAEFWTKVAERYDRVVDLQIGGTTRAMVRSRVEREGPLGRVAEFGCGTGFFTAPLAAKAESVVATDISAGMLAVATSRVTAKNVTFQVEDCQKTSFRDDAFDTAFVSLVIHFTDPARTVAEMRRIVKRGGMLIIVNLDPMALRPFARLMSFARIAYYGVTGYRTKPPKAFGRNVMAEAALRELLARCGFRSVAVETIKDASRSSNVPVEYVRAEKT